MKTVIQPPVLDYKLFDRGAVFWRLLLDDSEWYKEVLNKLFEPTVFFRQQTC